MQLLFLEVHNSLQNICSYPLIDKCKVNDEQILNIFIVDQLALLVPLSSKPSIFSFILFLSFLSQLVHRYR